MRKTTVISTLALASAFAFVTAVAGRANAKSETAPLDEAGIVAIFDLANTADIETGKLGAERAQNKEVRDYGTMLSQVHTEVRQKGRDLAAKLGVKPKLP